jgi:hypothetical protein
MNSLLYRVIFNLSVLFPLNIKRKMNEDLDYIRIQHKKSWRIIWMLSLIFSTIVSVLIVLIYDVNIVTSILLIPFSTPIIPLFAIFFYKAKEVDLNSVFIDYRYEIFSSYQETIDSLIIQYLLYIHPLRFLNTFIFNEQPSVQIIENASIFYLIFGIVLHFFRLYIKKTK